MNKSFMNKFSFLCEIFKLLGFMCEPSSDTSSVAIPCIDNASFITSTIWLQSSLLREYTSGYRK